MSAHSAKLPVVKTTASCKAAVIARITNDHLMAQIPLGGGGNRRVDHAVCMAVLPAVLVIVAGGGFFRWRETWPDKSKIETLVSPILSPWTE